MWFGIYWYIVIRYKLKVQKSIVYVFWLEDLMKEENLCAMQHKIGITLRNMKGLYEKNFEHLNKWNDILCS